MFSPKSYKNFITQIISGPNEDNDYEVKFLKRSSKVKDYFVFPEKDDLASTSHKDFVYTYDLPSMISRKFAYADDLE